MVYLSISAVPPHRYQSAARAPISRLSIWTALVCATLASASLWAQTTPTAPAANNANRSEDPAYSVFRWIKIQGDAQRKPAADAPKPKPAAAATPVRKPETQSTAAPTVATERAQASTAASTPAPTAAPTAAVTADAAPAPAPANVVPVASSPVAPVTAAEPATAAVETSDELDADLKIVSQTQPTFPRELRNSISQGKVVVSFTVQPDGTVAAPTALSYSNRRLARAATDAVSQWLFEPIRTARTVQIEIAFNAQ